MSSNKVFIIISNVIENYVCIIINIIVLIKFIVFIYLKFCIVYKYFIYYI